VFADRDNADGAGKYQDPSHSLGMTVVFVSRNVLPKKHQAVQHRWTAQTLLQSTLTR
jgi:hypothetical protein